MVQWKDKDKVKIIEKNDKVSKRKTFLKFPDGGVTVEDAFMALMLVNLRDPLQSSDTKFLAIIQTLGVLEQMGYTEDQIRDFKKRLIVCMNKFMTVNSFMG